MIILLLCMVGMHINSSLNKWTCPNLVPFATVLWLSWLLALSSIAERMNLNKTLTSVPPDILKGHTKVKR